MALSIASELRIARPQPTVAALDELADALGEVRGLPPREALFACADLLSGEIGLRPPSGPPMPGHCLLDSALAARRGHPSAIAVVYAEVGARVGLPLTPALGGGRWLVALTGGGPSTPALDLGMARPDETSPTSARYLCSHELAYAMLGEVAAAYERVGDRWRASRAIELMLALPFAHPYQEPLERRIRGLRSCLN
jgi:hypothetical protein